MIYTSWDLTQCFSLLPHLQLVSLIRSGCIQAIHGHQWEHELYEVGFPISRESFLLILAQLKMM